MYLFQRWYRIYGVRLIQHLMAPPIHPLAEFSLPRGSVYHYLPEDGGVLGMPSDHIAVQASSRLIMVDHVETLTNQSPEGRPRLGTTRAISLTRDYHRRNRKLKLARNLETNVKDDRTLLICNYALLPELYRYTQSVYSSYYEQVNIEKTLWENVARIDKITQRNHFIPITLPTPIPSLRSLRITEEGFSRRELDLFTQLDTLLLISIWKWLGERRSESHLAQVPPDTLRRTTLLLRHENRWMALNLGTLDDWRNGLEDEGDISPQQLQKRFLRLIMRLAESSTTVSTVTEDDADQEDDQRQEKAAVSVVLDEEDDTLLDQELDALNDQQKKQRKQTSRDIFDEVSEDPLKDGIIERANALAEEGVITAAEYRRFEKLSERYRELPDPRTGKGSLVASSEITADDVAVTPTQYPDSPTVPDKGMLQSSLDEFDSRYVKEVLPKDVSNMVLSLNKAGVAVTDYNVEEVYDVANHFEIHTVKVTPIQGKPSTIRFRLPVINKDGTYVASGVKYRFRRQKGDVPIRKVKPDRVALTSYYGKVFVERNAKAVHNYSKWLIKEIDKIGIDSDDSRITGIRSAEIDLTLEPDLPRLLVILAAKFASFKVGDYHFNFNYKDRKTTWGKEWVESAEADGMVVIGKRGTLAILVDNNDTLYLNKKGSLDVLGKIEDVVGLDRSKAPSDTIDLKVFSKSIPLGVVLGYYFGLESVLDALEGDVRRVPSGSRLELESFEVPIRFQDETLILNRDNALLTMIVGGFNEYKTALRRFSIHDFNRPDVYLNLIESYGLADRHLKELELMRDMFIDPITEEILKEMGEPTSWNGLLKRAAELLLTDYSPHETDMAHMRIRGYERIAGAVYNELVQATRGHALRGGSPSAALDVNPFAVWTAIQSDPSKTQEEDSNPIQNLKQKESLTFMGTGGRSRVSMVGRTRVFGENDMGVISEATVDSGDAGINASLAPNPNLTSLRGMTRRYDKKKDTATNLVSTSALLTPSADRDDPKRVN